MTRHLALRLRYRASCIAALFLGIVVACNFCLHVTFGGSSPVPATRPSYDWLTVDEHKQISDFSCIPMSLEMVLKLEHRKPIDFFDLQKAWNNSKDGTLGYFDGTTIAG